MRPLTLDLRGVSPLTHVRAFGCLCYPTTVDPKIKFGERAPRGIYLGRSTTQPAYLVYIPSVNKLVITPHVAFVESIFPGVGTGATPNPIAGQSAGVDLTAAHAHAEAEVVSEPGIVPDHMELEAVTEETTYVELMEDNIQVDDLANASNNDNLDRVFAAGGSSSSWPSSTISQRLTRNRDKRDTGPPAMTVGDIRPTGTLFCLYLCSGPRRPADLAEQLNLLGALSVVLIDEALQGTLWNTHTYAISRVVVVSSSPSLR
eukprot:scaffold4089_cov136-Isochrysis_galbana.AAC.1